MTNPNELTVVEAAARIAAGTLTAEALTRACLDRIGEREDAVGAWHFLDRDLALAQARALDGSPRRGPLHGIPVGVKDIIDTADMPTAYGSTLYAGHRPPWDASCVALARRAGAVILGKTVTTVFAYFDPGKTANPRNTDHTPGGSSSGSAAAVADDMVPLAFGTQTAGSVIRPASYCGIVGYKPTYGLLDRTGIKPLAPSLDTLGVMARAVGDAALFVAVLSGRTGLRPSPPPAAPPRIGLCRTHQWPQAEDEARAALEEAASRLSDAGADIREIELPEAFAGLADAHHMIMAHEASQAFAHERLRHESELTEKLRELLDAGSAISPEAYDTARTVAAGCRARLETVFGDRDALLCPSTPGEAPRGHASTGRPVFNSVWTLLGVPCITLPGFSGPRGLPVGVQLVGRVWDDARLLAAAAWAEPRIGG
jgi:amidase